MATIRLTTLYNPIMGYKFGSISNIKLNFQKPYQIIIIIKYLPTLFYSITYLGSQLVSHQFICILVIQMFIYVQADPEASFYFI